MQCFILAAGEGFKLDGFNKLLLKHPLSGKTLLQTYIDFFGSENVVVGLGYRAISVVHNYPNITYAINNEWGTTNSAHTFRLCLEASQNPSLPTIVIPDDIFLNSDVLNSLLSSDSDLFALSYSSSSKAQRVNFSSNPLSNRFYFGPPLSNDPEVIGVFRFANPQAIFNSFSLLENYSTCFLSEVLASHFNKLQISNDNFQILDITSQYHEIESVEDYLRFSASSL